MGGVCGFLAAAGRWWSTAGGWWPDGGPGRHWFPDAGDGHSFLLPFAPRGPPPKKNIGMEVFIFICIFTFIFICIVLQPDLHRHGHHHRHPHHDNRRAHECEPQLKEWTSGSVFGGVSVLTTLLFLVCPGSPTLCCVEWRLKNSTSKSVSGGVVLLGAVSTRPGSAKVEGVARHLHDCRCECVF